MIFIALVAVAVWLADLRLAVALPLVALAWLIAAVIEYLAWRSARGSVAVVETGVPAAAAVPPPAPVHQAEPEPEPVMEAPPVEQTIVQPAPPEPEAEAEPRLSSPSRRRPSRNLSLRHLSRNPNRPQGRAHAGT